MNKWKLSDFLQELETRLWESCGNLSPTAPIAAMGSDGYFSIVGADTVSTLKDKALKILGVEL